MRRSRSRRYSSFMVTRCWRVAESDVQSSRRAGMRRIELGCDCSRFGAKCTPCCARRGHIRQAGTASPAEARPHTISAGRATKKWQGILYQGQHAQHVWRGAPSRDQCAPTARGRPGGRSFGACLQWAALSEGPGLVSHWQSTHPSPAAMRAGTTVSAPAGATQ